MAMDGFIYLEHCFRDLKMKVVEAAWGVESKSLGLRSQPLQTTFQHPRIGELLVFSKLTLKMVTSRVVVILTFRILRTKGIQVSFLDVIPYPNKKLVRGEREELFLLIVLSLQQGHNSGSMKQLATSHPQTRAKRNRFNAYLARSQISVLLGSLSSKPGKTGTTYFQAAFSHIS